MGGTVPIIEAKGLTKHYGTVKGLKGISFNVEKGEIIGLLGPNGAGKTTTMKLLTGYLQPTDGTAKIAGHDVVEDPLSVRAVLGYLPENAPLYLDMAVQEYLLMMAELRGIPADRQKSLLSDAIYSTAIETKLTQPLGSLSKGFRQRVCLAQAILHKPQVLILDEPTNGLDPTQIIEMRSLIKRLAEHATVMVSTHILSEVEATCHRAIIIMEGEIKADAKMDELTASSAAVVSVEKGPTNVEAALSTISGIRGVKQEGPSVQAQRAASAASGDGRAGFAGPGPDGNYVRYRVIGEKDVNLCPAIYDV